MKNSILLLITLALAIFVVQTAVRIEVLNVYAGYVLPRQGEDERREDGSLVKWRNSGRHTPSDELLEAVQLYGILQYLCAPILLVLSISLFRQRKPSWVKFAGGICALAATAAIVLMFYRGYFTSLGG